ncbi:hypothetical protein DY000_02039797 [Brassica cretica]|uniref:Uncharacterized protein n=1 Tax=Brassica cretica TaxID=69181 RepID=A0ABQ7B693_BRACR|nr:hypothetical protein DY000_02039797 [Brassica cretica]
MHLSSLQSVDLIYKKVAVGHRRSLFPQFWEAKNVQRGGKHIFVDMIPLGSKGYECVFDIEVHQNIVLGLSHSRKIKPYASARACICEFLLEVIQANNHGYKMLESLSTQS